MVACIVTLVAGFSTVEITAPTSFQFLNSTLVNISGGINTSGFPFLLDSKTGLNLSTHVINVTILTKTTAAGSYSILATSLPLTINATNLTNSLNFWNFTATLPEGRNYIRLNFTNVSRNAQGVFGGALSAERIVQIDTNLLLINITNKIHFENNISINSYQGGARFNCGVSSIGTWNCSAA